MKKALGIFFTLILRTSCEPKRGSYYFNFDNIEYYTIEIDENKLLKRQQALNLTANQKLQNNIIIGNIPKSINDTSFLKRIQKIGFEKNEIKSNKYEEVKEVFREKYHKISTATSCIAVYRDILIFRKKDKVIGIAKICFECGQSQIFGTNSNTSNFGQSGDYSKLANILQN